MTKHLILSLLAAASLGLAAQAQQRTVTERDSLGRTTRIIEVLDTVRDGRAETDTLSITTYEEPAEHTSTSRSVDYQWDITDWENLGDKAVAFSAMVAFGMFLFFITPVVLIILIFYFRNKNRKRKYLLLQQALANGQPLPKEAFKEITMPDNRVKGFRNVALGIGIFIFLWALTGEFGLACVGLLVMFVGFGQLAIHYTRPKAEKTQQPQAKDNEPQPQDDEPAR